MPTNETTVATKPRILFVDDEAAILELLRMSVEAMGEDWETRCADSGDKALSLMANERFDVVMSDMRMPGMTGAQLLNEVMKRHPATGRIILSGYAEQAEVLRCVGATHQFLAKPCPFPEFKAALKRIRTMRERLRSEEIQRLVAERESLPGIPAVYFKIMEAVQQPDCPLEAIASAVATDPALTAKVLQLVNSAFFGFAREVSSADEAVMLLGLGTIRSLALVTHLFWTFEPVSSPGWSVEEAWRHSLRVGQWAKRICEAEGADEGIVEQAFTAGVLHDVGKLLLAAKPAGAYLELIARSQAEGRPLVDAEREVLGASHAEVGAYLLDLWGLPAPLVEAVALHHEPSHASTREFGPLTALHVANVLEHQDHNPHPQAGNELDCLYLDAMGLSSRIAVWRALQSQTESVPR